MVELNPSLCQSKMTATLVQWSLDYKTTPWDGRKLSSTYCRWFLKQRFNPIRQWSKASGLRTQGSYNPPGTIVIASVSREKGGLFTH